MGCTKQVCQRIVIVVGTILLSACTMTPPKTSNPRDDISTALRASIYGNQRLGRQTKSNIPYSVDSALMPNLNVSLPAAGKAVQQKFNIAVDNVPAKDFFMGLVKGTKYNMVVDPTVQGNISLHLNSVTIPEVLDAARDVYGYEYQVTPYGYHVSSRSLKTRIYTVHYLDLVRKGKSLTNISSGEITKNSINSASSSTSSSSRSSQQVETKPTAEVTSESTSDLWKELKSNLDTIVGSKDGHSVVINRQAGMVIVKAYPNELREVTQYLDDIENIMQREVIIEAKVLEVQLSAKYQAGINWSILGLQQIGNQDFNDDVKLADFANIFKLDLHSGQAFSTVINLLNSQGRVNVLSSPHIATLNNQKAVIKVGEDEFFVTDVSDTSSTATENSTETQNIELTPFFSGIALDVTPEINKQGNVILHIHPVISKVEEQDKTFTVSDKTQELPLAKSTIRESDSIVEAKNGQVIVIGGLMENASGDYKASTPGMHHIPVIGDMLGSNQREASKLELVILLRPVVIQSKTWTKQLKRTARIVAALPNTFGYEARLKKKQKAFLAKHPIKYRK